MLKIKRRDFLKGSIAVGTAAALSGVTLNALTPSNAKAGTSGAESPVTWTPSMCLGCTTWCSIEVGTQEAGGVKRIVDIRGNQNSGTHDGYLCPKGRLAIQEVYDPDRLKVPMKRTNPTKGRGVDPMFVPITWDEAIQTIAGKLIALRGSSPENTEAHKVVMLRGRYTETSDVLFARFAYIYGTPNYITHSSICAEGEKWGHEQACGLFGYPDYDIDNCDALMLWGVDPTSSNRMTSGASRKIGQIASDPGKVLIAIDPKYNATAAKAGYWLQLNPGTDGALALAMAHHILVSGLWNKDFVGLDDTTFSAGNDASVGTAPEKGTKGLVNWWNIELKNRTPGWAEGITGIPASTIRSVAEAFASKGPKAISWVGPGIAMQPVGAYGAWAAAALNGLVGSYDHIGGVLLVTPSIPSGFTSSTPSYSSPVEYRDAIAMRPLPNTVDRIVSSGVSLDMPAISGGKTGGVKVTNKVADAILNATPYRVKMVIANFANFPFSCQEGKRWEDAFSSTNPNAPEMLVVMSTHLSEFAMFADIVLPSNNNALETKSFMTQKARKHNVKGLINQVIEPLWDTKDPETEVAWLLAERMMNLGFDKLYNYYRERFHVSGFTSQPANAAEFRDIVYKYFMTAGTAADRAVRWAALTGPYGANSSYPSVGNGIAQGTYSSTYFVNGRGPAWRYAVTGDPLITTQFGTASKKIEFCNDTNAKLKAALDSHAAAHSTDYAGIMTACNYTATAAGIAAFGNIYALMPHYEPPRIAGSNSAYPFILIDSKSRLNREGRSQNAPFYYQFKCIDPGDVKWSDVIKIHPDDARALGLSDGSIVKITSPSNSTGIICQLRTWKFIKPGTAVKTYGQGHWAYGRFASAWTSRSAFGETVRGGNNNEIIPADYERLSGSSARNGVTMVNIELVKRSRW